MQHPEDGTEVTTGSIHPDEGTIHAWLDGELSSVEADALRRHLTDCADCRVAVAEARGLVAASTRIVRSLDDGPGGMHSNPSSGTPTDVRHARAGDRGGQLSSMSGVGQTGVRSMNDARVGQVDPAAKTRAGRRWRLSAIAAVGLMAVGTTLVLQRSGPLAPITAESSSGRAAEVPPTLATAADSQLPLANRATASETEAAEGSPLSTSGERSQAGRVPTAAGAPADEKSAPHDELRTEAPPLAVPPRPPQPSAAAVATGGRAELDSAEARVASAFIAPAPPAPARLAPQTRAQAGVAAVPSPARAQAASMAVGPVLVGRVISEDGHPVGQALVTVPGTSSAAVTDVAGRFRLDGMPVGEHTATVRRTGFEPARLVLHVAETGDSVVTVALVPAVSSLGEMVATGVAVTPSPPTAEAGSSRRAATSQAKAPPIASPPARPPGEPSPTPATADATARDSSVRFALTRRLAGCYRLEVGGAPSVGREAVERALPGWIRLLDTPAPGRSGWLEATPLQRDQRTPSGGTAWRIATGSEIEIVWPTASGAREVILRLSGSGEVLTGTASLRSMGAEATEERDAASMVAVRGVCTS